MKFIVGIRFSLQGDFFLADCVRRCSHNQLSIIPRCSGFFGTKLQIQKNEELIFAKRSIAHNKTQPSKDTKENKK